MTFESESQFLITDSFPFLGCGDCNLCYPYHFMAAGSTENDPASVGGADRRGSLAYCDSLIAAVIWFSALSFLMWKQERQSKPVSILRLRWLFLCLFWLIYFHFIACWCPHFYFIQRFYVVEIFQEPKCTQLVLTVGVWGKIRSDVKSDVFGHWFIFKRRHHDWALL